MQKTFIGLDSGSDSVRALLVSQTGEELKSAAAPERGFDSQELRAQARQKRLLRAEVTPKKKHMD